MVTITELRKEAAKQKIKGRSTMTKIELCAALREKGVVFDNCEKGAKKSPKKKSQKKDYGKMNIYQVKAELQKQDKSIKGNKATLLKRLENENGTPARRFGRKPPIKKSPIKKSPIKKSQRKSPKKSPKKDYGKMHIYQVKEELRKQDKSIKGNKATLLKRLENENGTPARRFGRKTPVKKFPAKKSPAKKSPAKKSPAKKSPARSPQLSPRISPLPSDGKIKAYLRNGGVAKVSKGVYDMVREILIREKITQKNAEAFIVKLGKLTRPVSVHAGRVTALIKDVELALEILDFMKRDYSNEGVGELSMEDISVLLQKGGKGEKRIPPDVLVIIKRHETLKKNSMAFFSDLGRIIHLLAKHAGRMTPTRIDLNLALRFYEGKM